MEQLKQKIKIKASQINYCEENICLLTQLMKYRILKLGIPYMCPDGYILLSLKISSFVNMYVGKMLHKI
jgi:hypothetical protein